MSNVKDFIKKRLILISIVLIIIGVLLSVLIGFYSIFIDILGVFGLIYSMIESQKEKASEKKIIEVIKKIERTEELEKIIRKLRGSMKEFGISKERLIEEYDNPINALVILKFRERKSGRKSTVFRDRLSQLGFKYIQNGVWILPPVKTPDLRNSKEIKKWVYSKIIKHISNDLEYVIPFTIMVDIRRIFCEKKVPAGAWGRTIFDVLGIEDIFKPNFIMKHFAKRNVTIEDMIKLADIIFLGSRVLSDSDIFKIEDNRERIKKRIKKLFGKSNPSLSDYADINFKSLVPVLDKIVKNSSDVARTIVEEAKFWQDFFEKHSI